VLAKGQDLIALKIREIAEKNDIPVVEDKMLARSMYDVAQIDRTIPADFFRPVAEIIYFLHSRKNGQSERVRPIASRNDDPTSCVATRGTSLGQVCVRKPVPQNQRTGGEVGPIYLFDVASSQERWLSLRQATVSANVANANTPGYRAQDIEPFNKILDAKVVPVTVTSPMHITTGSRVRAAGDAQGEKLGDRAFRQLGQPRAGNAEGR
jgi:flagellar basal body rod protein FlgB/type III secretion system FlhB-like substrate exporter